MYKRDNKAKETFGDFKESYGHDRLYGRGHDNVQVEMYLVAIGHNIRKYHKLKMKQKRRDQENNLNIFLILSLIHISEPTRP